jgi:hypothetical protein
MDDGDGPIAIGAFPPSVQYRRSTGLHGFPKSQLLISGSRVLRRASHGVSAASPPPLNSSEGPLTFLLARSKGKPDCRSEKSREGKGKTLEQTLDRGRYNPVLGGVRPMH